MSARTSIVPFETISPRIRVVRGQKVILDEDLATLYEVNVRALNQAVRRNLERFPSDFMFQLTREEYDSLRSQTVILEAGRGAHRKYLPYAFTEHGVAMLSSVLRSRRAIHVNIAIMRAFTELRRYALTNEELRRRLDSLERNTGRGFRKVFDTLRKLIEQTDDTQKPTKGFAR